MASFGGHVRDVRLPVREGVRVKAFDFPAMCGMCGTFGLTHAGAHTRARAPAQVRMRMRAAPAHTAHGALARFCTRTAYPHVRRGTRTGMHRARARLFPPSIPEKGEMA